MLSEKIIFYFKVYLNYIIRMISNQYFRLFLLNKKLSNLEGMLGFCSKKIPFYFNKDKNIKNYPCINKFNLIQNLKSMTAPTGIRFKTRTSGTTGTPCDLFRDINSVLAESYFQNKYFGWNSMYRVIIRCEQIYNIQKKFNTIFKKIPFIKEIYVSTYHLEDENKLNFLIEKLKRIKNKCLWAYPSTAFLLAEYCIKYDKKLKFDLVATSSEVLFSHQIPVIEKAFDCKIKDWYGLAERVAALYRCEYGNYHEVPGYSYIEYLHDYDDIYEIVGTSFFNKVMPLVRYKTGDFVTFNKEVCKCGNNGKSISSIIGRDDDFIDVSNKKLPGILLNIVYNKVIHINESQIIQKKDKSFVIKIVKRKNFDSKEEKILKEEFFKLLPPESCTFEYVNKIEKCKKYRFIVKE